MPAHHCRPSELDRLHADIALASAALRVPAAANAPACPFIDRRLQLADLRRQAKAADRADLPIPGPRARARTAA